MFASARSTIYLVAAGVASLVVAVKPSAAQGFQEQPKLTGMTIFQIQVAGEDLPPREYISMLAENAQVLKAAAAATGAKSVKVTTYQQQGLGSSITRPQLELTLDNGQRVVIRAGAHCESAPEAAPRQSHSYWGQTYWEMPYDGEITDEGRALAQSLGEKLTDGLLERIRGALDKVAKSAYEQRLEAPLRAQDMANGELAQAATDVEKMREEMLVFATAPAEVLQQQLASATSQVQSLELEQLGLESRRRAIEEQLAKAAESAAKALDDDEVVRQHMLLVEARDEVLKRFELLVKSGTAAPGEFDQAKAELVIAKAELAEARRLAAKVAGGDLVARLRADLVQTEISLAECSAKLGRAREFSEVAMQRYQTNAPQSLELKREKLKSESAALELRRERARAAERELDRVRAEYHGVKIIKLTPEAAETDTRPAE